MSRIITCIDDSYRCEIENSNFIASIFQYQKRIQDDPNQYLIVVTSKSQNQTRMKIIEKVR